MYICVCERESKEGAACSELLMRLETQTDCRSAGTDRNKDAVRSVGDRKELSCVTWKALKPFDTCTVEVRHLEKSSYPL